MWSNQGGFFSGESSNTQGGFFMGHTSNTTPVDYSQMFVGRASTLDLNFRLDSIHTDEEFDDVHPEVEEENDVGEASDMAAMGTPLDVPEFYTTADWNASVVSTWNAMGNLQLGGQGDELRKGDLYETKQELIDAVRMFSIRNHRQFKVVESKPHLWIATCHKANECSWKVRGRLKKKNDMFEITNDISPHTCVHTHLDEARQMIGSKMIGAHLEGLVKADPCLSIKALTAHIRSVLGLTPPYKTMWRGRNQAIANVYGDWDESYKLLPRLLEEIQATNPGTVVYYTTLPTEYNNVFTFQRVFFAFSQSITAFEHCRPVITIDATHLYGKYMGKMFIAMGVDANDQLMPLAFMVADDSESLSNWEFFLRHLRTDVVKQREVCLISDRHVSIMSAVGNPDNGWVAPYGHHRICLRHFCSNLKKTFKDPKLKNLVYNAATQPQLRKFRRCMRRIEAKYPPEVWQWLHNEPYEKWTLAHDAGWRYGIMTTNLVEGFNGVLKGTRALPLTASIQCIFTRLVTYFVERRPIGQQMLATNVRCTPAMENRIRPKFELALRHEVTPYDLEHGIASVKTARNPTNLSKGGNTQIVNMGIGTCECGKWQLYKWPCSHVIAVCNHYHLDAWNFMDKYFMPSEYNATFTSSWQPLRHVDYWPVAAFVLHPNSLMLRKKRGRPVSTRYHNEMDEREIDRQDFRCSYCHQTGHNRRSCLARSAS